MLIKSFQEFKQKYFPKAFQELLRKKELLSRPARDFSEFLEKEELEKLHDPYEYAMKVAERQRKNWQEFMEVYKSLTLTFLFKNSPSSLGWR